MTFIDRSLNYGGQILTDEDCNVDIVGDEGRSGPVAWEEDTIPCKRVSMVVIGQSVLLTREQNHQTDRDEGRPCHIWLERAFVR